MTGKYEYCSSVPRTFVQDCSTHKLKAIFSMWPFYRPENYFKTTVSVDEPTIR